MQTLSSQEIRQVSGAASFGQTVSTGAMIAGGGQLGSAFAGARLGGLLGSAAGPFGAVAGAVVGGGLAWAYFYATKGK